MLFIRYSQQKLKDIRKQSAEMIQSSSQFRDIQQIRHKLLCFVNALQNHITSIAIEGSWQKFQDDLKTVRSMEDLYRKHTKYLKRVKFLCMLNRSSQEFYTKIESIFVLILRFCRLVRAEMFSLPSNFVCSIVFKSVSFGLPQFTANFNRRIGNATIMEFGLIQIMRN